MARSWSFPPFRLDLDTGSLWRDDVLVALPPKAFAVLATLVAQAGQVVTKEALFEAVWPDTAVTDGVLKGCIRQIRRALGERAGPASCIATVHRRGYRWCLPVTPVEALGSGAGPEGRGAASGSLAPSPVAAAPPSGLVGRAAELAQLQQCWAQACLGRRQVVFITGEAGIGKTTLVDAFMAQLAAMAGVWSARGQCIEHYGAGEAYLPLLEALGQLGREPDGAQLVALLHQVAPTWLVHLPALVPAANDESVQRRAGGATRERMLRELAEVVEGLTAQRPVVLVLEDLHWSDQATLDWLAYIARRRAAARLLVLGTYRPAEAVVQAHPVRRVTEELRLHGQAVELPLRLWAEPEVAVYLTQRFGVGARPERLARGLHQRTEGNPLFLVTVVDELVRRGVVRQDPAGWDLGEGAETAMVGVPESLRQLVEQQLEQLPPEAQQILEAAGVVGVEFTAAAVAAGVEQTVEQVEEWCTAWARRGQFVQTHGVVEWPDGTVTAGYGFRHALYREILYERVPISRRLRWHRQIGLRLEMGYGLRAREVAAELAEHFVRGRDLPRAVRYLEQAGDTARQRNALHEAATHLREGLALLTVLPESPAQVEQELTLLYALGLTLSMLQGQAAPEVGRVYDRARVLCQQLGDTPRLFLVLMGLRRFYSGRGALQMARAVAEQLDELAQRSQDPEHRIEAHFALGLVSFCQGDLVACRAHTGRGLALDVPSPPHTSVAVVHGNRHASCLNYAALALWGLGYPDQALHQSQEAVTRAQEAPVPSNLAFTLHFAACLRQLRREAHEAERLAAATMSLATDYELGHWLGQSTIIYGWAAAARGQCEAGLAYLRQGLTAMDATGSELLRPYYLALLAAVYGDIGQHTAGQALLAEAWALVDKNGERWYAAELHRLQGALLLPQGTPAVHQAEQCFQQALHIAQTQQARTFALRAATSLSRLWQQQGKRDEARELLAPIYGWFTEGFDTADLQEAKALLKEPSSGGEGPRAPRGVARMADR